MKDMYLLVYYASVAMIYPAHSHRIDVAKNRTAVLIASYFRPEGSQKYTMKWILMLDI